MTVELRVFELASNNAFMGIALVHQILNVSVILAILAIHVQCLVDVTIIQPAFQALAIVMNVRIGQKVTRVSTVEEEVLVRISSLRQHLFITTFKIYFILFLKRLYQKATQHRVKDANYVNAINTVTKHLVFATPKLANVFVKITQKV